MKVVINALRITVLLAVTFFLLTASAAFLQLSYTLTQVDHAVNSIALDVNGSSLALNARIEKVDPLLAKAGKSLDSLDAALRAHKKVAVTLDRTLNDERAGLKPTLQNVNATLIQSELWNNSVREALIEQRSGLLESNAKLTATLEESRLLLADIRARVNDPAVAETQAHLNNSLDAVDAALHPAKQTRGQKALGFILQVIFGNAVQGAVRR